MKKILEVLRYGENDIRFHTDIDPKKDPEIINQTVVEVAMAMMTTLWGGNEQAVLAMIRALSIADLGVSVNRRQMISFLDDASESLAASLNEARKAFEEPWRHPSQTPEWSQGRRERQHTGRLRTVRRSRSRASRPHRPGDKCARW